MQDEERVLIKYTVKESKAPFLLQFHPFLAFRNIHALSKANIDASKKSENVQNGIKLKMYSGFSNLFIQFSKKQEYLTAPDWHFNNEYVKERERGYAYNEDLYCPGYFTSSLKKGDCLIFSAGLSEIGPRKLKTLFDSESKKNLPLHNFKDCLERSSKQFIVKDTKSAEITAGFHWFGQWGRDTFIALPGLTLSTDHPETCKLVLDTMLKNIKNGLFPNIGKGDTAAYNTADASLWFFWTLQQYAIYTGTSSKIWNEYGSKMRSILENYSKGTLHNIHMDNNGLLFAGETGVAITWMDAVVNGKSVTPRIGLAVELNALWYNAVCFALEAANLANDKKFISEWESLPIQIELSFTKTFWSAEKKYLADHVNGSNTDWSLRPNQIFAASLPYSPINNEIKRSLLEIIKAKLLTPRGLRTLAPEDKHYKGVYAGNHNERDYAYHQGTVWLWLLGHFAEAYLKTHGESANHFVQSLYENFAPAVLEYGIGTIAEIYDGNAPHSAKGAISQAWSVAELLRIRRLITDNQKLETNKKKKEEPLLTI
jgi:predicted glycogen debranching enzyme